MSLTRKMKKSELKKVEPESETQKPFNVIVTPQKLFEWDQIADKHIPPAYNRVFIEFLKTCPREEVKI